MATKKTMRRYYDHFYFRKAIAKTAFRLTPVVGWIFTAAELAQFVHEVSISQHFMRVSYGCSKFEIKLATLQKNKLECLSMATVSSPE
jgi:hypothetical protein